LPSAADMSLCEDFLAFFLKLLPLSKVIHPLVCSSCATHCFYCTAFWCSMWVNVRILLNCLFLTSCVVRLAVQQEPRVVQLVSHPFLGQDILRAGPSQFGLSLKAHEGVSIASLLPCCCCSRFFSQVDSRVCWHCTLCELCVTLSVLEVMPSVLTVHTLCELGVTLSVPEVMPSVLTVHTVW